MTLTKEADPMTVYLLTAGEEPVAVPGLIRYNFTTMDAEGEEVREHGRLSKSYNRGSTLRRIRVLRRLHRRANPDELSLTLDYDPGDRIHQELLAAGESDATLTLRFAISEAEGHPARTLDADCSVLRYNTLLRHRDPDRPERPNPRYTCDLELRLERHGDFRNVDIAAIAPAG